MADHVCGRVAQNACELIVEIGRKHDVFCGLCPNFGFVFHDPVANRVARLILDGVFHFDKLEHRLFDNSEPFVILRLTFVEPNNNVAQCLVVLVKAENGVADNGEGDGDHIAELFFVLFAKLF